MMHLPFYFLPTIVTAFTFGMASTKGRPQLTPELQEQIVKLYAGSFLLELSAARCGVTPRTVQRWRQRGRVAFSGKYYDFEQALKAAEANHLIPIVNTLRTRALGGVIMQPRRQRYTDLRGVIHFLDAVELDANGQPVYEPCVVESSERAAMFLAERLAPEQYGEQNRLSIDAKLTVEEVKVRRDAMAARITGTRTLPKLIDGRPTEDIVDAEIVEEVTDDE